jgi:hypothetical protein
MSKRSRNTDNSKRPQPLQQQRAQARQPAAGGSNKADTTDQREKQGSDRAEQHKR